MKKKITVCDVYGSHKVTLSEVRVELHVNDSVETFGPGDLSERAIKRLRKFIEKGMSAPGSQGQDADS